MFFPEQSRRDRDLFDEKKNERVRTFFYKNETQKAIKNSRKQRKTLRSKVFSAERNILGTIFFGEKNEEAISILMD